jgi:hypothetical protein
MAAATNGAFIIVDPPADGLAVAIVLGVAAGRKASAGMLD